jgi:rRNA-processing protein FCF1
VVVVTNDAEIARDVRAVGANVLPSNALLAVL